MLFPVSVGILSLWNGSTAPGDAENIRPAIEIAFLLVTTRKILCSTATKQKLYRKSPFPVEAVTKRKHLRLR